MILAFGYEAASGKSEASKLLNNSFGLSIISFATPIKQACKSIFKLSDEQLYGAEKEVLDNRWDKTPRELFQSFGEHMKALYGKDIWVRVAQAEIEMQMKAGVNNFVIDDLRFPIEGQMIKSMGGHTIMLNASFEGRSETKSKGHISENSMKNYDWDFVINNNRELEDFYSQIYSVYNEISKDSE